jgi:hypothetical protein
MIDVSKRLRFVAVYYLVIYVYFYVFLVFILRHIPIIVNDYACIFAINLVSIVLFSLLAYIIYIHYLYIVQR